ncbi:MAG: S9 family peptidase, partial [Dehalococcoidia bacterium]
QISPDGKSVAYVVGEIDREADDYRSAVWLVSSESGEARRLTAGGKNDSQPRWSSDGRSLAFVSDRTGDTAQLYVIAAGGGEARKLTDRPRGVSEPAWSPDGRTIAFVSRSGPEQEKNAAGTLAPRVITMLKHKFNGRGFFDGSHMHIYIVSPEGGEPRQLSDGDWDDGQIAWSPDSTQIAFVSARHPERDRDRAQDLWTVSAAGAEPRQLTHRFGPCGAPTFSPDGATIAFSGSNEPLGLGHRDNRLWTVPSMGGEPRELTGGFDRGIQAGAPEPGSPAAPIFWSPSGDSLIARVQDGPDIHLYRFSSPAGRPSRLVGGERSIEALSMARDGHFACLISDLVTPAEVFITSPDGSGERRLTSTNDELVSELRFPEIEPVSVQLADGATIEGWLLAPLDLLPERRYPLVLDVHGGPHGAFLHAFRGSYPLILSGLGCAVLQMNPRGSTGWGEAFARSLHGGRGERDLPELLASLDTVLERGWIDPDRLGITGYSYGGYMTAWAIGQTDRFKGAVWGAGTADLYCHFGYTDMTVTRYAEMGGSPWEHRDLYLRQSPISYVQQIQTPLLMLHGENDLRCNPHQADEFFTALKYFEKEVVLVRYPGENHMLRSRGKPSHRLDYDQRLLDWFERWLALSEVRLREAVVAD